MRVLYLPTHPPHSRRFEKEDSSMRSMPITQVSSVSSVQIEHVTDKQGMTIMRGPISFSTNQECGLLIDGFDEPPMVMMTYNPRSYARLIESCDYHKAMDLFAYIGDLDERLRDGPPKLFHAAQKAAQK